MTKTTLLLLSLTILAEAHAARLKDLTSLRGARSNTLTGYGIVIGLQGTGDKNLELTNASLQMMLKEMGMDFKEPKMETKNVAAVVVSATLPAFAKVGTQIDVSLSSIGTASSLEGGNLMMTALKGADGHVYGIAQGRVVVPKRGEGGKAGSSMVTAQVPNGASLEKEIQYNWNNLKELRYQLVHPDFTTAARIAKRINEELAGKYATPADASTVEVIVPYTFEGTTSDLIAMIEWLDVEADQKAKVVINQRTGTVVLGENVKILPVAIAHNNLKIEVMDSKGKGSGGEQKTKRVLELSSGATVSDLVGSLNATGASADDLMQVLQALKQAGALVAELEIH